MAGTDGDIVMLESLLPSADATLSVFLRRGVVGSKSEVVNVGASALAAAADASITSTDFDFRRRGVAGSPVASATALAIAASEGPAVAWRQTRIHN